MRESLHRIKLALEGRYAIEREIGSGGMATVHLATDQKHDRQVAVKILRSELAAAVGAERFLREISITAKLNHPHILPLLDSGDAEGFLYYVMPYLSGGSLRGRLDGGKRPSIEDTVRITSQVAAALDHAHRCGVIHRDIKPENILFSEGLAVVADFGIAKAVSTVGRGGLTRSGFPLGTPGYMSPEQAAGRVEADERTDVCGLACVVYEMLVGDTPGVWSVPGEVTVGRFAELLPSHRKCLDQLAGPIEEVLVKALAMRSAHRFVGPIEFARALTLAAKEDAGIETSDLSLIDDPAADHDAVGNVNFLASNGFAQIAEEKGPGSGWAGNGNQPQSGESTRERSGFSRHGNKLRIQRTTKGEAPNGVYEAVVHEIDHTLGIVGLASSFGRSLTWSPAAPSDEERNIVVKITPHDGQTRVHVEERIELAGMGWTVSMLGVVAGAAIGLLVASVFDADTAALIVSAVTCAASGAFGAVRFVTWGVGNRRRPQLEVLSNRLTEIVGEGLVNGGEVQSNNE